MFLKNSHSSICFFIFLLFLFFCIFRAAPEPGSSQVRGPTRAATAGHSNTRSKPCLQPTACSQQWQILNQWVGPRIEPASSCILVGFVTAEPKWALLIFLFLTNIYQVLCFLKSLQMDFCLFRHLVEITNINQSFKCKDANVTVYVKIKKFTENFCQIRVAI